MKITVSTTVAAPLHVVWRAYTAPENIKIWNTASPDWHTTVLPLLSTHPPAPVTEFMRGLKVGARLRKRVLQFIFFLLGLKTLNTIAVR